MRILVLAAHWRPSSQVGAERIDILVRGLFERGWEVRGLSATPGSRVNYRDVCDVLEVDGTGPVGILKRTAGFDSQVPLSWQSSGTTDSSTIRRAARNVTKHVLSIPDDYWLWACRSREALRTMMSQWRPDVVISSALPLSCHMVAAKLRAEYGIPWIADFRDMHTGDPYLELPLWRGPIDRQIEVRAVRSSYAITSVNPGMAQELGRIHQGVQVRAIRNSAVLDEVENLRALASAAQTDELVLAYGGTLYEGRRNPLPLIRALTEYTRYTNRTARIDLYGPDLEWVAKRAGDEGIADAVCVNGQIGRAELLKKSARASATVVFLNDTRYDRFVSTGKLYELMSLGRPVLAVGGPNESDVQCVLSEGYGIYSPGSSVDVRALLDLDARVAQWDVATTTSNFDRDYGRHRLVEDFSALCTEVYGSC